MIRLSAFLVMVGGPAFAHGSLPGAGGFLAGALHPFLVGEHVLVLLGLGLILGRRGSRRPLPALLAGLMAGFVLGGLHGPALQAPLLLLALAMGGALAAAISVNATAALLLALICGLLVGADTDGPSGEDTFARLAGVATSVFLIVLNAMAVAKYGATWLNGVPLRVAGSWVMAASTLVLAFLLRVATGLA